MAHGVPKAVIAGAALVACLAGLLSHPPAVKAAPDCTDVALVLAIDSSGSVTPGEFLLEKRGISAAFRDPGVQEAISRAGRVAVSAVFWGSDGQPGVQTEWVIADGADGANRFARMIEQVPRQVTGDTGLGAGLTAALAQLTAPDVCAARKIINLSGDGEETRVARGKRRSAVPAEVRDLARSLQVEINALAISSEQPGLAAYYAGNVITGPNAFVMEVRDYAGFSAALRRKLIREISPQAVAAAEPPRRVLARIN